MIKLSNILNYIKALQINQEDNLDRKELSSILSSDLSYSIKSIDHFDSLERNEKTAVLADIFIEVLSNLDEKTQSTLSSVSYHLSCASSVVEESGIRELFNLFDSVKNPSKEKIDQIILKHSKTVTKEKLKLELLSTTTSRPIEILNVQIPIYEEYKINSKFQNDRIRNIFRNIEYSLVIKIQGTHVEISQTLPSSAQISSRNLFYIEVNTWELSPGDSIFMNPNVELEVLEINSNIIRFNLNSDDPSNTLKSQEQNTNFSFGNHRSNNYFNTRMIETQFEVIKEQSKWIIKNKAPHIHMMVGMLNMKNLNFERSFKLESKVSRKVNINGNLFNIDLR